jgi:hypothetical protein
VQPAQELVDTTQVVVELRLKQLSALLVLEMVEHLRVAHQQHQLLILVVAVMLQVQFLDLLEQVELLL